MFRPENEGDFPTLGWEAIRFMQEVLVAPDAADYVPFTPYREQARFLLEWYRLHPVTGKRIYRRGVLSRCRGWGKSPFLAAVACFEGLGDCVFDGWDAHGQPVGKPWSTIRTPLVQIAAVSQDQAIKNSWGPVLEMLQGPALDLYPGLEPMETFVNLPRGRIEYVTASARTIKGNRSNFVVLDQTEEWVPSVGGPHLAQVIRTNAAKIGGTTLETPNAFIPGEESVAETSARTWQGIQEGRSRGEGLYYDHLEAPAEVDIYDDDSLLAGITAACGDSAKTAGGHIDELRRLEEFRDTSNDIQKLRGDYLNQITHASDAWLSQPEWAARVDVERVVADREQITLGFDGSRGRARGMADATALVAVTVDTGYMFDLGVWEQPEGPTGRGWTVPTEEVEATLRFAFDHYDVVGFYADPSLWEDHIARWEAQYRDRLKVQVTRDNPIEWKKSQRTRVVAALEALRVAIATGEMTHNGSAVLTRHFLNARRRPSRAGILIGKEHPDSVRKIDAAYAGMLAWQARLDAVSAGVTTRRNQFAPRRIR